MAFGDSSRDRDGGGGRFGDRDRGDRFGGDRGDRPPRRDRDDDRGERRPAEATEE